jgi:hypothetical protein
VERHEIRALCGNLTRQGGCVFSGPSGQDVLIDRCHGREELHRRLRCAQFPKITTFIHVLRHDPDDALIVAVGAMHWYWFDDEACEGSRKQDRRDTTASEGNKTSDLRNGPGRLDAGSLT